MKKDNGSIILSPTDLMRFAACQHQTALDLRLAHGEEGLVPRSQTDQMKLIAGLGNKHERECLETLESEAGQVTRIIKTRDFDEARQETLAVMQAGADIIYQGALSHGYWAGYVDFMVRVDGESKLGSYSYEAMDAKLKRQPDPSHIIQLVVYSDLIEKVQGHLPKRMHIHLGTRERASYTVREFADYVRLMQRRLEAFVSGEPKTRPIPCAACEFCGWKERCDARWEREDSLFRVANIRKDQVSKLEAAGVRTLEALVRHRGKVPRLAEPTLDQLQMQARLQHKARETGGVHWKLRDAAPGKGFALLPEPSAHDLFFDIEGYPYFEEAGQRGLEYLHGVWDGNAFTALWAHSLAEEKRTLIALFDLFRKHTGQSARAHIYHYAPYEITALRNMTARHSYGEAQLDTWLREKRFVDLYAVVRSGIALSEPRYSIKNLEALYLGKREGGVTTSAGSIIAYSRWLANPGDDTVLRELEEYNKVDCVSTEKLRDWLWEQRPEHSPPDTTGQPASEEAEMRAAAKEGELRALEAQIDQVADIDETVRSLMKNLIRFHSREAKPAAWKVFDSRSWDTDQLLYDAECLEGLQAISELFPIKRSFCRTYRFETQPHKLKAGSTMQFWRSDAEWPFKVTVEDLDRKANTLTLKTPKKHADTLASRLTLIPPFALPTRVIHTAVGYVVLSGLSRSGQHMAARDILTRHAPRFKDGWTLAQGSADALDCLTEATAHLDSSVLPVQGPPGTGKTYVSARAILSLVQQGRRVAVTSNSHEAIINVLKGCEKALNEDGAKCKGSVSIAYKCGRNPPEGWQGITRLVRDNKSPLLRKSDIVGGTAWLFCRQGHEGEFDYLFVDEAGQVPLANLIGMTRCAKNVVLVGDPCQLPQVIQGAHPYPANLSCLEWMLQGMRVIDEDCGVFLPDTYRMHPDLCAFISEQFYEGRLGSRDSTRRQSVGAAGIPAAGAFRLEVRHEGRSQECGEEVEAIRRFIELLLRGTWTGQDGQTRPLRSDDIIIVAPFNAQVNRLTDELPGMRVGTVDKFQGQEAPVALLSMTSSSADDSPRGLDFLFSRERINVAMSRGQALSVAFVSPTLLQSSCATVEHMRMLNPLCALNPISLP